MGYEKYREDILRPEEDGHRAGRRRAVAHQPLLDEKSVEGKPGTRSTTRPWDSLSEDEKKLFTRMAEVYAGSSSYADDQIGRLIDYLEETGQLDNTIIVRMSDNGASGEGGPNGRSTRTSSSTASPTTWRRTSSCSTCWAARDLQPLPDGLGVGVQHAVQDVQAPQLGGWRRRPVGHLTGQGHQGQGRAAPSVHACHRHRADGLRVPGCRAARRGQGLHPGPLEGQLQVQLRGRQGEDPEGDRFYPMLGLGRCGTRAGRSCRPSDHRRLGHFGQDSWELYDTTKDRTEIHDLRRSTRRSSRNWSICGTRPACTTACRSKTGRRSRS